MRKSTNRLEVYSKRFVIGDSDPARTGDLRITNALHYQLCYTSILNIDYVRLLHLLPLYNQSEIFG